MKHWISLSVLIFGLTSSAFAVTDAVLEESLYTDFQTSILNNDVESSHGIFGFSSYEQSLYVDALWDLAEEKVPAGLKALDLEDPAYYDLIQKLRLGILRLKYGSATALNDTLKTDLMSALQSPEVDVKIVYTIAVYEEELAAAGHTDILELAKKNPSYFDITPDQTVRKELSTDIATDLVYKTPDASTYMNGEYADAVKIFMFCRTNRIYGCLMIMKDSKGNLLRNEDGSLWTHRALASSKKGLPSYSRNGNTPEGMFTIDSVMPVADAQQSFGKFRRMILNFVPKSPNEALIKSLLPKSSQESDWWKPTVVARNMGRNLFRIHGSGSLNLDPTTPYYPLVRTSGCIAQAENTYDGIVYKDQRILLDTIMKAKGLKPTYENELHVKGIIYVFELDDAEEGVTLDTLNAKGIE